MTESVREWLEVEAAKEMEHQRAQAEHAKLIVVFSTGVAATLVATALQVGTPSRLDWSATALLAITIFLAASTLANDRLRSGDNERIVMESKVKGWTDNELLDEFRVEQFGALNFNRDVIKFMRVCTLFQAVFAALSIVVGALSLLFQTK